MIDRTASLREVLAAVSDPGAHPAVARFGWRDLSAAARDLAAPAPIPCDAEPARLLREIGLKAAASTDPEPRELPPEHLYGHGVRQHAAHLLVALARHGTCRDAEIEAAIRGLASDPEPDVRHSLIEWLNVIGSWDLFWEIADDRAAREPHHEVAVLLLGALFRVCLLRPEHSVQVVDRVLAGPTGEDPKVSEQAAAVLLRLAVQSGDAAATARLHTFIDDPPRFHDAIHMLFPSLRSALVEGLTEGSASAEAEARRQRAQQLFRAAAQRCVDAIVGLERDLRTAARRATDREEEWANHLMRLIDTAAHELLFASHADARAGEAALRPDGRATYYREIRDIVATLGRWGHPSVVHILLDLVGEMADVDPRTTWPLFLDLAHAGIQRGYQAESLAEGQMDQLVRMYLRDHREVVETELSSQGLLVRVLDAFVGMGWPSARRLVYELDELFR